MTLSRDERELMEAHALAQRKRIAFKLGIFGLIPALFGLARCTVNYLSRADVAATCSAAEDCASGYCLQTDVHGGICTKSCETDKQCWLGARCNSIAEGHFCTPVRNDGEVCGSPADCRSGVCTRDLFQTFGQQLGRCAEGCGSSGLACGSAEFCSRDQAPVKCVPLRARDQSCQRDEECRSGDCTSRDTSSMEAAVQSKVCS